MVDNLSYYKYNGKEKRCWVVGEKEQRELVKKSEYSFKVVFQERDNITLTVEELATNIITFTLHGCENEIETIQSWEVQEVMDFERMEKELANDKDKWDQKQFELVKSIPENWQLVEELEEKYLIEKNADFGNTVWNKELKDYEVKFGLPKTFYFYWDEWDKEKDFYFWFDFINHLIDKDKDENKNWYWYQFDMIEPINQFICNTLMPYIKPSSGEIVAIPYEEVPDPLVPWLLNNYQVNFLVYPQAEINPASYDFGQETREHWDKNNNKTALVISYLPTYITPDLGLRERITGTRWVDKLWDIFISRGVPVVLKVYPGFYHQQLYTNRRHIFDKVSAFTELPQNIAGREVGSACILLFFNVKITSELGTKFKVPWNPELDEDKKLLIQINQELTN